MSYILHMSDLHYGQDTAKEKERIHSLAKWINDNNIKITFIVFTGDMIDAPAIKRECLSYAYEKYPKLFKLDGNDEKTNEKEALNIIRDAVQEVVDDYNRQLFEVTSKKMTEAGELFNEFVREIGVGASNVVLCCGNHDRMRYVGKKAELVCKEKEINQREIEDSFKVYDNLCKMINNRLSHDTYTYQHGGINFIIANTNWRVPTNDETNNMCVNCSKLWSDITKLNETKEQNKMLSFFVAHKPSDDFCETAKFPYGSGKVTLMQEIERSTAAFFYGDKHSYITKENNELHEYMCGKPLSHDSVHYNLVEYDKSEGIKACSFLVFQLNEWHISPTIYNIEKVYNVSKGYIKPYALSLLSNSKEFINWDNAIDAVKKAEEDDIYEYCSKMFLACCDVYPEKIEASTNFFEMIFNLVLKSNQKQSLSIKGVPGSGKSTALSLFYLKLLSAYYEGRCTAIPFYFNFGKMITELVEPENNVQQFNETCLEIFMRFFIECKAVAKEVNKPIWLIVDGMQKSQIIDPREIAIEKKVYFELETKLDNELDRYIIAYDIHGEYAFTESYEKINQFESVIYINPVRIISYKEKEEKQKAFLENYMKLSRTYRDEDSVQQFHMRLLKYRKPSIDLFFLHSFQDEFEDIDQESATWTVLKRNIATLEKILYKKFSVKCDVIQKVAALIYCDSKTYSEVVQQVGVNSVSIQEFITLCNTPILMNYLTARFYVSELRTYSQITDTIPQDSILYSFLPNDISIYIRLLLDEQGRTAYSILERFVIKHGAELSGHLYAMIVYLCGHLRNGDASGLLEKIPQVPNDANDFYTMCQQRSLALARATCSDKSYPATEVLIQLMDNESYRHFNRSYQLHYYRDISNRTINTRVSWNTKSEKNIGFDFRYTFLTLLLKLEDGLNNNKTYPLLELDLYTLCDLVYSRLQYCNDKSLFYSSKYNEKEDSESEAILNRMIKILDQYTKFGNTKNRPNKRICAYFSFMKDEFTRVKVMIISNQGKTISIPYVAPVYDYETACSLSEWIRVGWEIDEIEVDSRKVAKRLQSKNKADSQQCKETIMEHVMGTVYMAQMFLPEKMPEPGYEGYDKYKIIYLLLFSEMGRAQCGDFSPVYSNARKLSVKEDKHLSDFLVLGSLDGYADFPIYFESIREKYNQDINQRIALDIKLIQMEYKYYSLYEKLNFSSERRCDFEKEFEDPTTDVCKDIRNRLILENPKFVEYLNRKE